MDTILDLHRAPTDPYERMIWLSGVEAAVEHELEAERQRLAYEIRLNGGFDNLLALDLYPRTVLLRWTRRENRRRGNMVRWSDGLDAKSSAYTGASTTR